MYTPHGEKMDEKGHRYMGWQEEYDEYFSFFRTPHRFARFNRKVGAAAHAPQQHYQPLTCLHGTLCRPGSTLLCTVLQSTTPTTPTLTIVLQRTVTPCMDRRT